MKFKTLALLLISVFSGFFLSSKGQGTHEHHSGNCLCGTDSLLIEALKNPEVRKERARLENFTQNYIENELYKNDKSIKVIPVVFHVIHQYGEENITKAQIEDALRIANEDFKKLNSDITDVIPNFSGITGNVQVEFRLARKDPNGLCTDGITRTESPLTFSADDNVKDLIVWNTNKYLNIWVVNNISFGAGGYSYLPGSQPNANYRGVVLINTQLGSIGTSNGSNFASRTLTHEIGHYFNLYHPWGWSNDPGLASNCNMDDDVSDTPNTVGTLMTCNLNQTSCSSLDNVQNFMDYATCSKMFTEGQVTRMQAALNSTVGGLSYLWQTSNLIATGTNDGYSAAQCAPKADFSSDTKQGCAGVTINYFDESYNADVDGSWSWQWAFPGGTPSTSTLQNPTIVYATPGKYNASLTVSNSTGSNTKTKIQYVQIYQIGGGESMPLTESFEQSSFPNHPSDPLKNWIISGNSSLKWERSTAAAVTGSASMRIRNATIPEGSINYFMSPNIDMGFIEAPVNISFKLAYAQRTSESNDRLRVLVSKDCGKTWIPRYSRTGVGLVSNGGAYVSTNFVPTSAQWKDETVNVSTLANSPSTLIQFECRSEGGNYMYIDDINITGVVGIEESDNSLLSDFQIFPNPLSFDSYISFTLTEANPTKISIYDIIGHKLASFDLGQMTEGIYDIKFSEILSRPAQGMYIVEINSGTYRAARKVAVTEHF
ncbi:MAG: M43 family zinc metalloprotease [Bacteroidales bacterium]|nr:M43 family zinc metalloprotease [Bacteroidales bacterium]